MDEEIKAKWVAALRSGKYKQGSLRLKRNLSSGTQHCCLGVLCEVLEMPESFREGKYYFKSETDFSSAYNVHYSVLRPSTQNILTALNDEQGKTFNEIADYIEETL